MGKGKKPKRNSFAVTKSIMQTRGLRKTSEVLVSDERPVGTVGFQELLTPVVVVIPEVEAQPAVQKSILQIQQSRLRDAFNRMVQHVDKLENPLASTELGLYQYAADLLMDEFPGSARTHCRIKWLEVNVVDFIIMDKINKRNVNRKTAMNNKMAQKEMENVVYFCRLCLLNYRCVPVIILHLSSV